MQGDAQGGVVPVCYADVGVVDGCGNKSMQVDKGLAGAYFIDRVDQPLLQIVQ